MSYPPATPNRERSETMATPRQRLVNHLAVELAKTARSDAALWIEEYLDGQKWAGTAFDNGCWSFTRLIADVTRSAKERGWSPARPEADTDAPDCRERTIFATTAGQEAGMDAAVDPAYSASADAIIAQLLTESGCSDVSTENARALIVKLGKPNVVVGRNVEDDGVVTAAVTAIWEMDNGAVYAKHTFTGFGWGHAGAGPAHLVDFFRMLGVGDEEYQRLTDWPTTTTGAAPVFRFTKGIQYDSPWAGMSDMAGPTAQ